MPTHTLTQDEVYLESLTSLASAMTGVDVALFQDPTPQGLLALWQSPSAQVRSRDGRWKRGGVDAFVSHGMRYLTSDI